MLTLRNSEYPVGSYRAAWKHVGRESRIQLRASAHTLEVAVLMPSSRKQVLSELDSSGVHEEGLREGRQ